MPSMHSINKAFCLLLMPGTAALVVWWWGWSMWTLLLVAVMLSCPVVLLYLWYVSRRSETAVRAATTFLRDEESTGQPDGSGKSRRTP
jgi:hypothetical protein